jgi:hypothetical protein
VVGDHLAVGQAVDLQLDLGVEGLELPGVGGQVGLKGGAADGSAAARPRSMLAAMRSALPGSCQMCGSGAPPTMRSRTPWLVSTTGPSKPELSMVSLSHASRPTPFSSTRSAWAMASMSAGEGS